MKGSRRPKGDLGGHPGARGGLWPQPHLHQRPVGGTRPGALSTASAPSDSYKYRFDLKSSGATIIFQKHHPTPPPPRTLVRGDPAATPGTLPEGRSIPKGSTSPCLPLG